MNDALQCLIDEVLNPLLKSDESSMELLRVDDDEVVVRVSGKAAFGAGAEYVRSDIIERALRKAIGDDRPIRFKKTIPTAKRRA